MVNAAALLCLLMVALPGVASITPLGSWQSGIATNYGGQADGMSSGSPSFGTLSGSCGFGQMDRSVWPYWSVAALATSSSAYSGALNGCGTCWQIECLSTVDENKGQCSTGAAASVVVMISDSCPECASNQIDIQAETFAKIAPESVGRINTRFRRVECSPPADMKVDITDYRGGAGWVRLNVQQAGGRAAIQAIQVKGPNSGWESLNNIWGATWESASAPNGALSFRFVPDQGGEVTAFNILTSTQTGMIPTHVQFQMHDPPGSGIPAPGGSTVSAGQVEAFSGPSDSANSTNDSSSSSSSSSSNSPPSPSGSPPPWSSPPSPSDSSMSSVPGTPPTPPWSGQGEGNTSLTGTVADSSASGNRRRLRHSSLARRLRLAPASIGSDA